MIIKRNLTSFALVAALGMGASVATFSPSEANAGGSCSDGKKQFKEVEEACKKGLTEAKKMMKGIEKKAKKAGKDWKCKHCHENQKDFKLKDNAEKDYKEWRKLGGYG